MKKIKKHGIRFSAYLIALVFLALSWWIGKYFGSPSFEQILFHFQNGNEGLVDADPKIFRSFLMYVVGLPILVAIIVFALQQLVLSKAAYRVTDARASEHQASLGLRSIAVTVRIFQYAFNRYMPICFLGLAAIVLANKVALWSYIQNHEISGFIEENYVIPNDVRAPKKKLNLVLIYVESLESVYPDPASQGGDLIAPLAEVTKDSHRFSEFKETNGTGWTIAGIVSTQCGIPLKSHTIFNNNDNGEIVKSFLPGAICLGDILAKNGYKNVFLGGASLFFAGKGKFLSQHGYSELYGREDWSRLGYNKFNDWGLYDDDLFREAKIKLDQLQKSRQPFNLTLLTLDTHPPYGFLSRYCAKMGERDYKLILNCTANLVVDFVQHMKRKGYLENTVVVILGDHLLFGSPARDELTLPSERNVFNRIIAPSRLEKNRETVFHFDFYPSILYSMGFVFDRNRLGLGGSGFGYLDPGFTIPKLDHATFNGLISQSSKRYLEFWNAGEDHGALDQKQNKH